MYHVIYSFVEHGKSEQDLSPQYWNDLLCLGVEDKWPLCSGRSHYVEFIVIAQLHLICILQLLTSINVS